jgi:hypothetical protein
MRTQAFRGTAGLVLALLVLGAIVTGVAAPATTTVIPKQLSGRWGREHQTMLMVVSPRGKVDIVDAYHATFSRVTAHRLTISYVPGLTVSDEPSCDRTGTYRWKFTNIQGASDHLKLTKIHDGCKSRVHLFTGLWLTAYHMP